MMPRLCWLLVTLVPCAGAQSDNDISRDSNRVRIRIEKENHVCDPHTRVSLVSDSGPTVAEGYANTQCVAEFFGVSAGNYHVVVSGPGISGSREFEIDANKSEELDVPVSSSGTPTPTGGSSAAVAASEFTVPRSARKKLESASRWIAKNNLPRAIDDLHQALAIDPTFAQAHYVLGVVYGRIGDNPQSRDALREALRLNDHLAPAYVDLALLEMGGHNLAEAEKLLEKAAAVGLSDAPTLILLASVELLNQHYDQAIANCSRVHATRQVPHASAHYIAARAYEHENRTSEALAELRLLLGEEQSGTRADAARKEIAILQAAVH